MSEKLLTSGEAAEYLGILPITLLRWANSKKIPGFKMGRVWRFKKERLDAWLDKQENIRSKR